MTLNNFSSTISTILFWIKLQKLWTKILLVVNVGSLEKRSNNSNICKPQEGWYGQPKYCYKKQYTLF